MTIDPVDLALPFRKSAEFVQAVVEAIGVLGGIALILWPLIDAVTVHRLPADGLAIVFGIGLLCAGYFAWGLRDLPSFARQRLLADDTGVQLNSSGSASYPWSQIAEFTVSGPSDDDYFGMTTVSASMRLQPWVPGGGTKIELERLEHWAPCGSRAIRRATTDITERVATLNGRLASAHHELEP